MCSRPQHVYRSRRLRSPGVLFPGTSGSNVNGDVGNSVRILVPDAVATPLDFHNILLDLTAMPTLRTKQIHLSELTSLWRKWPTPCLPGKLRQRIRWREGWHLSSLSHTCDIQSVHTHHGQPLGTWTVVAVSGGMVYSTEGVGARLPGSSAIQT